MPDAFLASMERLRHRLKEGTVLDLPGGWVHPLCVMENQLFSRIVGVFWECVKPLVVNAGSCRLLRFAGAKVLGGNVIISVHAVETMARRGVQDLVGAHGPQIQEVAASS